MVAHEHPTGYSAEPQMKKEMSAGKEASSAKALLEKRCLEFIKSLRDFPWFQEYQNIMEEFKTGEINIPSMVGKMVQLFQGHPELIAEFNHFLPKKYQVTIPPPTPQPRVVCRKRKRRDDSASDSDVCQKRKRRDDSDGNVDGRAQDSKFRTVLRCEKQTKARFRDEDNISDDGHQKALTLSPTTVPSNKTESDDDSTTDSDEAESTEYKLEKVIAFVNKVSERFHNNSDVVKLFLDMVGSRNEPSPNRPSHAYKQELELYKKVATLLEGEQDLIDEFTQFLTRVPRMDEIVDFPTLELCTPSYRLLPKTFPVPAATGRSKLASEVLNDRYICIDTSSSTSSSTSGGGGRRVNRKSQHELDLLDWEEEMYELGMSEEQVNSTSSNVKVLTNKIKKESPTKTICIEEHLSQKNLRCIERLYGDHGREMIDALKNYPRRGLPVILKRLKYKQDELEQERYVLDKKWAHLFTDQQHPRRR